MATDKTQIESQIRPGTDDELNLYLSMPYDLEHKLTY